MLAFIFDEPNERYSGNFYIFYLIYRNKTESSAQTSKAANIEMYAPSSYNDTVTGETLSSVSEKSDSYSNEGSQPDYMVIFIFYKHIHLIQSNILQYSLLLHTRTKRAKRQHRPTWWKILTSRRHVIRKMAHCRHIIHRPTILSIQVKIVFVSFAILHSSLTLSIHIY